MLSISTNDLIQRFTINEIQQFQHDIHHKNSAEVAQKNTISDYHFARIYRLSALHSPMPIPEVIRVMLYMAKGINPI